MRKYKLLTVFLFSFLLLLFIFPFTTRSVHASADEFTSEEAESGSTITWNPNNTSTSRVGLKNIGNGNSLGYAFGLAQSTSGSVISQGDDTVRKDTIVTNQTPNNSSYSKINIFLQNNLLKNYISAIFQSGASNSSIAKEGVSITSPDFIIADPDTTSNVNSRDFSLLSGGTNSHGTLAQYPNGDAGLKNKEYYIGTDANNNPAYKIVGDFVRDNNQGHFNLRAEILLRVSPGNVPVVQRELFLKNNTSSAQDVQVMYGEDTKLGSGLGSSNDLVQVKDLGNQQGVYIEDGSNKLLISNIVPDGFTKYAAQAYNTDWTTGLRKYDSTQDHPYGTSATGSTGLVDSSYTLKWDKKTIAPNSTAHFASTMGVTTSPFALPIPSKTFTNETTKDNTDNNVGDKLSFDLKMSNFGLNSNWNYKQLVDKIPDGLTLDPSTIRLITPSGATQVIPSSDFDATNNTLTIPTNLAIGDSKDSRVTFDATINNDASGKTLTNTGQFFGSDVQTGSSPETYEASVKIPVKSSNYSDSFTKLIKNHTDANYEKTAEGKAGDLIDYQIQYTNNSTSTHSVNSGSSISDKIPDGLTQVGDATITYSGTMSGTSTTDSLSTIMLNKLTPGATVTITYQAKLTKSSAGTITNTATFSGKTDNNITLSNSQSADLNVSNSVGFSEVPKTIDFGAVNIADKDRNLTNVSTKGQLLVNHPSDTDYKVTVSYDNTSKDKLVTTDGKALSSSDGFFFIKQRSSSPNDVGTWTPILSTGTPIQTGYFNGNQNLTNYVGIGDWKLNIGANTSPGSYSGRVTWGIVDSL